MLFPGPMFTPSMVTLMAKCADRVWDQIASDYRNLTSNQAAAVRERIASTIILYASMGIRDPLVLRAMALGVVKKPVKA